MFIFRYGILKEENGCTDLGGLFKPITKGTTQVGARLPTVDVPTNIFNRSEATFEYEADVVEGED